MGTQTQQVHGGAATFSGFTLDEAAAGYTFTVTSTASGAPPAITTNAFSVVAAILTQVIVTSAMPPTITAGRMFSVTVELEDPFENLATNYSGPVTASLFTNPGGGELGGNTMVTVSPTGSIPCYATFTGLWLNKAALDYSLGIIAGTCFHGHKRHRCHAGARPPSCWSCRSRPVPLIRVMFRRDRRHC